jgi:hypothetical protein
MSKKLSPIEQTTAAANDVLRSFVPETDFVGYPFGKNHPHHFRAGIASPPVPSSWIESLSVKKTGETAADNG